MTCYLVRHGKDDDSVRGGWSSSSLTDEGVAQAERLVSHIMSMKKINVGMIFSSDLLRARQTADILANALSIPVVERPEFREANNGVLAGMNNMVASKRFPGLYWSTLDWHQPYPEGESPCQFYTRISEAWNNFRKEIYDVDHDVILVTHGGVIHVIRCIESGIAYSNKENPFPIGNAEMIGIQI